MTESTNSILPTMKERMSLPRQAMPEQAAQIRSGNFIEVNLGFAEKLALCEAQRCLQCKNPMCVQGCPVMVNIPKFIDMLAKNDMAGAARLLFNDNALPSVTGRVCPQETQCECECIRGVKAAPVAIGYLERFVGDWARAHPEAVKLQLGAPSGKKVAIVGAGPAGLTAAGELVKYGHQVAIFEALHKPGGVLVYGIPEFRLPKEIVQAEIKRLLQAGVTIETNVVIGRTYTVGELRERYDAVFIANGAGLPTFMNIPGENLKGVYSANEYLTRVNLMEAYSETSSTPVLRAKKVAVIGGGNVAMDAVRTARRLGADPAMIVYRRTLDEMPARKEEVHHAGQEGVTFQTLTAPLAVVGDAKKWVTGLQCQRMELGDPDESGRRSPKPIANSEFVLECDAVIVAIGTRANPLLTETCPELALNRRGNIVIDSNCATNLPGVYAGGDVARGAATVILAMGDGKKAAKSIDAYLQN